MRNLFILLLSLTVQISLGNPTEELFTREMGSDALKKVSEQFSVIPDVVMEHEGRVDTLVILGIPYHEAKELGEFLRDKSDDMKNLSIPVKETLLDVGDHTLDYEGFDLGWFATLIERFKTHQQHEQEVVLRERHEKLQNAICKLEQFGLIPADSIYEKYNRYPALVESRKAREKAQRLHALNNERSNVQEHYDGDMVEISLDNCSNPIPADDPTDVSVSRNFMQLRWHIDPETGDTITHRHDGIDGKKHWWCDIESILSSVITDVTHSRSKKGFGNRIETYSPDKGLVLFYAHLATTNVDSGDVVYSGQFIGRMGNTGYCTTTKSGSDHPGTHLHLRCHYKDPSGKLHLINPIHFYKNSKTGEMAEKLYLKRTRSGGYYAISQAAFEKEMQKRLEQQQAISMNK